MKITTIFFFVLLSLIGCEKEDVVCMELKGHIVIINYNIPALKPDKYGFVIKHIETGQIGCLVPSIPHVTQVVPFSAKTLKRLCDTKGSFFKSERSNSSKIV